MIGLSDLQGHWRRAWLKAPGLVDHDTAVHWMQVGRLFADIRIPAGRPDVRGASALADLGNPTLLALLKAEGFAGEIALDRDICTWQRQINWHGGPETVDAGRMRLRSASQMIEDGVFAEYSELWHRDGAANAFARRFGNDRSAGYLVSVGSRFVLALGPREPGPANAARLALEAGERTAALERRFSEGYVFGRWAGMDGIACLATNPLWEGETVLRLAHRTIEVRTRDFHGRLASENFDLNSRETVAA